MSGHEITLSEVRQELEAQNRAFADAMSAMGITEEDLHRCDVELSQATVDGFWSEVFDIPRAPRLRPNNNFRGAILRA